MTIQEIMERTHMKDTALCVAWVKDAIHLIESQYDETIGTWKTDIIDASGGTDNKYPFPANMIKLKSISVLDTNDNKYKRIKRLVNKPTVVEDTDPNE
jgi:hypothetical protein